VNNVSNLSAAEKDRILAALLQNHPHLMETLVQQVTGNSNSPLEQPQQQQQQAVTGDSLLTLPHDVHGSDSSSSTNSETYRTMNNSPEAAASRKRRRNSPSLPGCGWYDMGRSSFSKE
jgi:hypothetical protein